jgi:hypothetical protein
MRYRVSVTMRSVAFLRTALRFEKSCSIRFKVRGVGRQEPHTIAATGNQSGRGWGPVFVGGSREAHMKLRVTVSKSAAPPGAGLVYAKS